MWFPGDGSWNRCKNISFVLMRFACFIADPCETNFLFFFFLSQGFLQRLFIHRIYFLGRDFNQPSPEELVAINFIEQLLKRELKANGLGERIGPACLMGSHLSPNAFIDSSS